MKVLTDKKKKEEEEVNPYTVPKYPNFLAV
jgi:hypothetical protein